jgi:hypothetical protein
MERPNHLQYEILNLFGYLSSKNNKHYCYPSQNKIKEILRDIYGIDRSTRTIRRHLAHLVSNGFLESIKRIKKLATGEMSFQTTIYFLTKKAYNYLVFCMRNLVKIGIKIKDRIKRIVKYTEEEKDKDEVIDREEARRLLRDIIDKRLA